MVKRIFLILLVIFPLILIAQEKGDNKIILKTTHTAEENFIKFGRHLIANGFEIRAKDETFLTLGTKWWPFKFGHKNIFTRYFSLDVVFIKNHVEITPRINVKGARGRLAAYNKKRADIIKGYELLEEILINYGGEITYLKQQNK